MWKKMPFRIFIAGEEKSTSSLKASKDRLILFWGLVKLVDYKLKPMFIYKNPRALKNY